MKTSKNKRTMVGAFALILGGLLVQACGSSEIKTRAGADLLKPRFAKIAGRKVRYAIHRHTDKTRPVLIMTNAWPQTIRCWESTWTELSRDFSLLAYDMPGFGLSPGAPEMMNPEAQAKFLLRVADHFGIKRFIGVGPDVGTPVMLLLAARNPERVRGIAVFDGPGFFPPDFSFSLNALVKYGFLASYFETRGASFGDDALRAGYKNYVPATHAVAEYRKANSDAANFKHTLAFIRSYPRTLPAIGKALGDIRVPALIMWGGKDEFVLASNAEKLRARIPGARKKIFAEAGHFMQEDAGAKFVQELRGWITDTVLRADKKGE